MNVKKIKIFGISALAISLGIMSFWFWSPAKNASDDFSKTNRSLGDSNSLRSFDEIPAKTIPSKTAQGRSSGELTSKNPPGGSFEIATSTDQEPSELGSVSLGSQISSGIVTGELQVAVAGRNPSPLAQEASPQGASTGAIATGGFSPTSTAEIVQNVPEGAKVPALFYDNESKPIPQQKALDRIAVEFQKNVSEIPPGMTKEEVWEVARAIADERYITLFGYQAFNQYHLQSAKEALKEKRARGTVEEQ